MLDNSQNMFAPLFPEKKEEDEEEEESRRKKEEELIDGGTFNTINAQHNEKQSFRAKHVDMSTLLM